MPASAQLLVILVAMLAFWAIVMRPARNQQKKVARLQQELEVGHQVVLSAGIFGTVRALHDGKVDLEIAPGTVITVARQVVVRRADELESRSQAAAEEPVQDRATSDDEPDARPQGDARTED